MLKGRNPEMLQEKYKKIWRKLIEIKEGIQYKFSPPQKHSPHPPKSSPISPNSSPHPKTFLYAPPKNSPRPLKISLAPRSSPRPQQISPHLQKAIPALKMQKKYWCQVVRNTVRSFGEIQLTIFDKYGIKGASKKNVKTKFTKIFSQENLYS